MDDHDLIDEYRYDSARLAQWHAGRATDGRFTRRDLARLVTGLSLAAGGAALTATPAQADPAPGPIVKPLPPELFEVYGSNAEMHWEAMADQGYLVPVDRFFVRDHTVTPRIAADTWRLQLFGTGLRGSPTADWPVEFSYRDLLNLPAESLTAFIECAGNGRNFFTSQQQQTVSGTAWGLGAVGVAHWRGVRLATVLRRAGLTRAAVDVMPQGLDPDFVTGGVNLGPVRRPLPVAKALHDVLLAYEMNGQPLPPDHGFPVRLVVPSWIGISSIKWVGRVEVSTTPLFSPWNTQFYRLFGPDYPTDGTLVTRQVVKSAFELAWNATLPAHRHHLLRGRSWSGNGPVRHVEVSTDDGATWRPARPVGVGAAHGWQRWEYRWRPPGPGAYTLRARATDVTGATQPVQAPYNTLGYLFGAIVAHPVTVA
ncbi:sulfite oxidase [Planosporangium thailandense]|uniref:Sulfite oxidase n=1 Tax=Planosporangium thailandense TaxID=765197 RepID=A0ABX0Y7U5_9ACTN|nr:sulfite oxidase [Planosporangium thailandense]NJC74103.1 sulfite oxidase [Planosporangium thailandense]